MAEGNLASVRSAAPPPWKVCLVGWGTLFRKQVHGSAVGVRHLYLPLKFTARSSGGRTAPPHAADAGSSPARVTIGRSRAPRSVLWAQGLRWTTQRKAGMHSPRGMT